MNTNLPDNLHFAIDSDTKIYEPEFSLNLLSVRASNVIRTVGIQSIEDLIIYYRKHKDFLNIKNCGKNTDNELKRIVELFYNNFPEYSVSEQQKVNHSTTLISLSKIEEISVRAYNVCKNNGLTTVGKIVDFFNNNNTFFSLDNCGANTNVELVYISQKYSHLVNVEETTNNTLNKLKHKNELTKINFDDFNDNQLSLINRLFQSNFDNLSGRAIDFINKYFKSDDYSFIVFNDFISSPDFTKFKINNLGNRTKNELIQLNRKILRYITLLNKEELDKSVVTFIKYFLYAQFNYKFEDSETIFSFIEESEIRFFKLINYLLPKICFNSRQYLIFKHRTKYIQDVEHKTLEQLGENLGVTRERARQLEKVIYKRLVWFISHFSIFVDYIDYFPENYKDVDILIIGEETASKINLTERTTFSKQFIGFVFTHILYKTHRNILKHKETLNVYLVENSLSTKFDFSGLFDYTSGILLRKIQRTKKINFDSYLSQFCSVNTVEVDEKLRSICRKLLFNEFELSVDFENNLHIKRNTNKKLEEYIYELLKKSDEPLHIEQIYKSLLCQSHTVKINIESIRSSVQRCNKFICFGRTSTYGLKEWEKTKSGIHGGTIRDIVEKFLRTKGEPVHITEITKYVNNYRETNKLNILGNLKMDQSNRFVFFNQSYVGLKRIPYKNLEYFQSLKSSARKRLSKEELILAYHDLKTKLNRIPKGVEMNRFGKYSTSVYRKRFGSWSEFLEYLGEK